MTVLRILGNWRFYKTGLQKSDARIRWPGEVRSGIGVNHHSEDRTHQKLNRFVTLTIKARSIRTPVSVSRRSL